MVYMNMNMHVRHLPMIEAGLVIFMALLRYNGAADVTRGLA